MKIDSLISQYYNDISQDKWYRNITIIYHTTNDITILTWYLSRQMIS